MRRLQTKNVNVVCEHQTSNEKLKTLNMKIVTEDILDQVVERFDDSDAAYESAVETMEQEQPVLLGYLFSEEFEAFTQEEKEYVLLLSTIIWSALKEANGGTVPPMTQKALVEMEEQNWAKLEGISTQHFHERINVFFEDYAQEDLLAFVEDALADDEEDPMVTKEAREAIFVTLKTVIDCLAAA